MLTFRGPPKRFDFFFLQLRGSSGGKFEHGIIDSSQTRDPLVVRFRLVLNFRGPPKNGIFCVLFFLQSKDPLKAKKGDLH